MDFNNLSERRFSVRNFDGRKVPQDVVDKILRAGNLAPTAKNLQPQKILVLQSEEALEKLSRATKCSFGCTLAFIVCYDDTISWKRPFDNKDSGDIDASIVATHMMLQARDLGVGSTWVMYFEPDKAIKEFNMPENIHPTAILVMGYPSEDATPNPRHFERNDISDMVVGETF